MKRIGAFSLAIFIFVLSVFSVIPVDVYADDDKTVLSFTFKQLNHSVGAGMSASDANAVVTAHKDIYTSDGTLLFIYNPSNSYNWTTSTKAYYLTLNYSDEQLKNILMSKNPLSTLFNVWGAALSNNNGIRAFCAGLGTIYSGNSDMGTKVLDTLSGNYNYLDSLKYDEDSQTITMSNDNGSVDKLREEIRQYYYDYIGLKFLKPKGTVKELVNSSNFRGLFEYEEDYTNAYGLINSKYAFSSNYNSTYFYNNKFADYYYLGNASSDSWNAFTDWTTNVYAYRLYSYDSNGVSSAWDINNSTCSVVYNYEWNSNSSYSPTPSDDIPMWICPYYGQFVFEYDMRYSSAVSENWRYKKIRVDFYSADGSSFKYFKSYSALYNYLHGDQNAYLSSKIEETGKDISYSIKDMNENLGSKMDELIDSINSGKGNMSADELQNAIDKGLEDLNKNTEDIKDNTSSILEKLEEQNQILLQILGVTEFIAYQEVKENSDQYNMSYLKTLLDSMFTGLFNALMYGENTVDDKNTDTASIQSFSVSNAAASVAVYSDDIAVYDSSGSGGGSSFSGGSDSSGGHFFDLKNGLFGKFPFSIPYQCYNWLQILQRDPEAPTFTLDYGYLFGCSGDPKFILSFDLSRYNDIAEVGRSFCRLFMTLMLALGIYHKNKGEM